MRRILEAPKYSNPEVCDQLRAGRRASKERLRGRTTIQPPSRLGAGALSSRRDIASAADRPKLVTSFWGAVLRVNSVTQWQL